MAKAYRFDDRPPSTGSAVHAFRTLSALKDFASLQGSRGNYKFWEIDGTIVSDDGGPDGITIRVSSVREVR